jgi:hypothetical protein
LQQAAASPAAKVDLSKEALVTDQFHTSVRMDADGTGTRETRARFRILADAGVKAMAVLSFTYTAANQEVDIGYVRVIKPDGSVVVTPDYNVQDMPADVTREAPMYSDVHQKHIAVKGLGVADTLEYQVTFRTLKPEVPGHFWLEYSFEKNAIVLDEQLDLDVPANKIVTVASADVQPAMKTENGRKLYHWASSNLARPDPDAPLKSTKNWKPSVQVTTFTSWAQVGDWYDHLQRSALVDTPTIRAKAEELTKGLTADEDKVRAIFNDVALHIHYVGLEFGIGRYQPHSADEVLSNEYGDCKDKHSLLASLLKAAGYEAWPVLISSDRDVDTATPSPAQFDHVITLVPLAGRILWMDSTEEIAPVGTLLSSLRDKQGLAIPANKPAYLEHTPADLPYAESVRYEVAGKLSDQGVFTGHFAQSYHGDAELVMRTLFRQVPQSQWKEFLQGISNNTGFAGEVSNPEVSPIEKIGEPLSYSYDYKREKFGDWENRRISPPFPPAGWELGPGVKQVKPADEISIGSPGEQIYRATVQLPAGWSGFVPVSVDLKEDWAEYHASYSIKNDAYIAERRLVTKTDKVPLDQWEKYLAFRRGIYNDEVRMTPLIPQGAATGGTAFLPLNGGGDPRTADLRKQVVEVLQPLREALVVLEAEPAPGSSNLEKASDLASKSVQVVEAKSMLAPLDDAYSLYWSQGLAYAWCLHGWAALEKHDIAIAESNLRAAWRLSQDRLSGYQLGRVLEAEGRKNSAVRQYELAHVASVENPLGGFLVSAYNVDDRITAAYKRLSGNELNSTALNRGQYQGSLRAELDKDEEIRQLVRATKLTGSGLFSVAFEAGKTAKATLLSGDRRFGSLSSVLQTHAFPSILPSGSRADAYKCP